MVQNNNSKEVNVFQEQVTALELQLVACTTTAENAKKAASSTSSKADVSARLQPRFDKMVAKDVVTELENGIKTLENKT